jgi:hypothetical protein
MVAAGEVDVVINEDLNQVVHLSYKGCFGEELKH